MRIRAAILFVLLGVGRAPAHAEEIFVAAASNLTFAMADIRAEFEAATGHTLRVSFGSSGNFFSQIRNGAPFDVFLSADDEYPRQLADAGLAEIPFVYGFGRIVVWTSNPALALERRGMNALGEGRGRVAIANPRHAPYGRAAAEALAYFGLADDLDNRLVFGENVSQAAQFVQSGAAETGVIALSLALSPPMRNAGTHWIVPTDAYSPIAQSGAILGRAGPSGHLPAARRFVDWLLSEPGRAILSRWGLGLPADEGDRR